MKLISLQWKEFGVDLGLAVNHIKSLCSKILAYSADYSFTLWYEEDLTEEEVQSIQDYWDSLSEEHEHCVNYKTFDQRKQEFKYKKDLAESVKASLVSKTWDEMNASERKLVMNLEEQLTIEELEALNGQ